MLTKSVQVSILEDFVNSPWPRIKFSQKKSSVNLNATEWRTLGNYTKGRQTCTILAWFLFLLRNQIPKLGCIRNFGNLEMQPFFSSTTQVFPIKNKTPEKLSCYKGVQFTYECFQLYTSFPVSPHAHLTLLKSKVQNETMSAALSRKTGNKQKVPHLERSKAKA